MIKSINILLFIFISSAFSNNILISQKEKSLDTKNDKNFNFLVDAYQQSILPFKDKRNMDMKDLRTQFILERKKLRRKYGIK
tara:strand:- start:184 stop:429 length:246 start_codon:yes stop_codon:yes gene_type:complete